MALSLPTVTELYAFWGDEADDADIDRANQFVELAANILWLDTGLDADPTDPRLASMVKLAILDQAMYLLITRDDIDANYSPFFSERVGSYTYSKAYSVSTISGGKSANVNLGVYDKVIAYFTDLAMMPWTSSEQVFHYSYQPLWTEAWIMDPRLWGSRLFGQARFVGSNQDDESSWWINARMGME